MIGGAFLRAEPCEALEAQKKKKKTCAAKTLLNGGPEKCQGTVESAASALR